MSKRTELQSLLESILGSRNVYFQPPESVKMNYPAIVYELDAIKTSSADSRVYLSNRRYLLTLIDKNPDTELIDELLKLQFCSFDRHFKSENLNHYVFSLYF